jgi:hypothetical protein
VVDLETQEIKFKGFECLGLLMIIDFAKYDKYLDLFMNGVERERSEQKKSKEVAFMLKALFDGVIVHSFFFKLAPPDPTGPKADQFDQRKLKLRQLLLKQLRDVDFNVRYLATEGFSRMLMCESTDKTHDFLSRLLLLQFEKIVSRPLTSKEVEIHTRIKLTIE